MIPDVYPKSHSRIDGAFIAGGWAVSPPLATDIDIWVEVSGAGYLSDVRRDVLAYLVDQYGLDLVKEQTDGRAILEGFEYATVFESLKVAKVEIDEHTTYHVLVTTGSIDDVINSFDLSIRQVAINELGQVTKGDSWTSPTAPIRAIKITPTSWARMQKYMARFNIGHSGAMAEALKEMYENR